MRTKNQTSKKLRGTVNVLLLFVFLLDVLLGICVFAQNFLPWLVVSPATVLLVVVFISCICFLCMFFLADIAGKIESQKIGFPIFLFSASRLLTFVDASLAAQLRPPRFLSP